MKDKFVRALDFIESKLKNVEDVGRLCARRSPRLTIVGGLLLGIASSFIALIMAPRFLHMFANWIITSWEVGIWGVTIGVTSLLSYMALHAMCSAVLRLRNMSDTPTSVNREQR